MIIIRGNLAARDCRNKLMRRNSWKSSHHACVRAVDSGFQPI
jgi:hypothetical protein